MSLPEVVQVICDQLKGFLVLQLPSKALVLEVQAVVAEVPEALGAEVPEVVGAEDEAAEVPKLLSLPPTLLIWMLSLKLMLTKLPNERIVD